MYTKAIPFLKIYFYGMLSFRSEMLPERKERIAVIVVESESHESLESRDSM